MFYITEHYFVFFKRTNEEEIVVLKWERKNCFSNQNLFTLNFMDNMDIIFTDTVAVNYSLFERISCDFYKLNSSPIAIVLVYVVGSLNVLIFCVAVYSWKNIGNQNQTTNVQSFSS